MRQFLLFYIISLICTVNISAQADKAPSPYLFDKFQDALVIYKDGRQFAVQINFNLVAGNFVFTDKADLVEKEFTNPELIVGIRIGTRNFLPTEGKATEIIQVEPRFCVSYTGNLRKAPKMISYGGTTETASVDNYSSLSGNGTISGVHKNDQVVSSIGKTYEIKVGKKNKDFYNKRSFLKIFPKEKRMIIESFIEEQKVDFESVDQVLQLYQYAIKQ